MGAGINIAEESRSDDVLHYRWDSAPNAGGLEADTRKLEGAEGCRELEL